MDRSLISHGQVIDKSWIGHGQVMDRPWICHGQVMDRSWIGHGQVLDRSWIGHGQVMDRSQIGLVQVLANAGRDGTGRTDGRKDRAGSRDAVASKNILTRAYTLNDQIFSHLLMKYYFISGIDPSILTSAAFELVQASQALQAVQAVQPLLSSESPPLMTPLTQVTHCFCFGITPPCQRYGLIK